MLSRMLFAACAASMVTVAAAQAPAQSSAFGTAEPAAPLTLPAALALATASNPQVAAARHELDAVDASVQQAGALPNPSLEMVAEDRRRETRTTTWQLSQPLELGGKRSARVAAARGERAAAEADLASATAELRANVITAFFDVASAQERLRLAQAAVDLAKRATDAASRRVTAGKISPVEATKARVAQANVQLEWAQAKSDLALARRRLASLWGNASPRFERADGAIESLPALPDQNQVDQRIAHAPTLMRAHAEVTRRESLADLERARRMPDVTVSIGVKREEEFNRRQAVLGVSVPLPLFDRNTGNVHQALRRADKARDELATAQIKLQADVAQAREQLMLARDEVLTLQQEILPGAQSAYDAASRGFEFGKFGFLEVLDAQRTLLEAQSRHLRALALAHRSAAELDSLLGGSPSTELTFAK